MCDGCHREILIEQCSNLVCSLVTPLPRSHLALALRTRTVAAISLTIAQFLLQLAALRRVLLVLVVRVSEGKRSRSGDTSRGGSRCRLGMRDEMSRCGDQIVALFRNTRILTTDETRKKSPVESEVWPSWSRRCARIRQATPPAGLDTFQSLGF